MKQLTATFQDRMQDSFWRNNSVFFVGSMVVTGLNYLYYPMLGRVMSIENFGELQLLMSLLNQALVVLSAINLVIIVLAANKENSTARLIIHLERLAFLAMGFFFVCIVAGAPLLRLFFKFSSAVPFVILGLTLLVAVLLTFKGAYLHGRRKFYEFSLAGIGGAVAKIIISLILIYSGLKTVGAITGILLAHVLAYWYLRSVAKQEGLKAEGLLGLRLPSLSLLRPQGPFIGGVVLVVLTTTLLHTGDILVIKHFFSPEIAGQYAGVAAAAKMIFFATASVTGVLIASVGPLYGEVENKRVLERSVFLVLLIGGAVLITMIAVPQFVIRLFVGERYEVLAGLLPLVSLAVFIVSVVNLGFSYFLAFQRMVVVPIALVGGLTTLILISARHDSISDIVQAFLAGASVMLALLVTLSMYYQSNSKLFKV